MGYENRLPPEGINVGKTNILAEVFWLLIGFAISVIGLVIFLYLLGTVLASYIPFSWELKLTQSFSRYTSEARQDRRSQTLQEMADAMAKGMDLPEGMVFNVKYVDDEEVNAYATVGGIIMLHRGLLDQLHSENAIAMVLAHEMAHIIHRDPAQAVGGRLLVSIAINLLAGVVGLDGLDSLAGTTSSLALLTFSREAERRADVTGLQLVGKRYGHMGGVGEVYEKLAAYEARTGLSVPEFMASHPETAGRTDTLRAEAQKMGIPLDGPLTPIPAGLRLGRK